MDPGCHSNAFADGVTETGGGVNIHHATSSAHPGFRVRPDIGWQPWTRPDGRTAAASECGREVTGSFWFGDAMGTANFTTASYVGRRGETVYYVSTLGNYTETVAFQGGRIVRGRYHHFIDPRCDRLLFAQNAHFDGSGNFTFTPRWFAPRRAAAPTVGAVDRARRPFCSPASSIAGAGGVWASKEYADWRTVGAKHTKRLLKKWHGLIPEDPDTPSDPQKPFWWENIPYENRTGIVADAIVRDCLRKGTGFDAEDIGGALGQDWSDVPTTELLYTVGGDATHGFYPIYWGEVQDAPTNYSAGRLCAGLVGDCDFTSQNTLPDFLKNPDFGRDLISEIDPDGLEPAFDLCVLFRTYQYKTRDMQTRHDVAAGYFNTHCTVRARVVAPCPAAGA